MNWIQDYGNELIAMSRGDYGTCPECGKTLTRGDIYNQIDAESKERAELCIACWEAQTQK